LLESENLIFDTTTESPIDDELDVFLNVVDINREIFSTFFELDIGTGKSKVESEI